MKNVIFGSGIVGLIARKMLGDQWDVIPYGRSRFYSHTVPLADNFIVRDEEIDKIVADISGTQPPIAFYSRSYSTNGVLTTVHDDGVAGAFVHKLFKGDPPQHVVKYLSARMVSSIYAIRVNKLYEKLQNEFGQMLKQRASMNVTSVGDHFYVCDGKTYEFDNAICTIPLPAILGLANYHCDLKYGGEQVVLVNSSKVDLEGANQTFVVDNGISFYKVVNLSPNIYSFHFIDDIKEPGKYLMRMIGNADIIDGTYIFDSIPYGQMPDLAVLENMGIFCVGSYAQHDWCADVGSNILRIARYASRSFRPSK